MGIPIEPFDGTLIDWSDLEDEHEWSLLLGNGFSRNVDEDFAYPSLFEIACEEGFLDSGGLRLFEKFKTTNFEEVLHSLAVARVVAAGYGKLKFQIHLKNAEKNVREALISSIESVHSDFQILDSFGSLTKIRSALRKYKAVYSTNYDLLIYWSVMSLNKGGGFVDFFWGEDATFDGTNVKIFNKKSTSLYYLHGGLHLYETELRDTQKVTSAEKNSILDQVAFRIKKGNQPLFVSEGNWERKYNFIKSSDYLTFTLNSFKTEEFPVVVFGHSLSGMQDGHIISAMKNWGKRRIAISVRPDSKSIVAFKATIRSQLPDADLIFFDSVTHPLGKDSICPYDYS